jgi:ferritin
MVKQLNKQVSAEFSASHAYLAMSCQLEAMGLKVLSSFFLRQSEEERAHALKIIKYLQEVGGEVKLDEVDKPKADFADVGEIAHAALKSEERVTEMIHDLAALAEKENDFPTRSFLNWFIDEQVEEVATMTDLVHVVKLAKDNLLQLETRIRHEFMKQS